MTIDIFIQTQLYLKFCLDTVTYFSFHLRLDLIQFSMCIFPILGNNEKLDSRRNRGRPKSAGSVRSQRSLSAEPIPLTAFSETVTREKYDPGAFTGHHVSDLHRENEQLRAKVPITIKLEHQVSMLNLFISFIN